jgi:hypothetical protein
MPAKGFDASKYLRNLNGREYLEVKWRLLWLRTEHPEALVQTELVKHGAGLALFRARVSIPGGGEASGWGSETADDFGDYIEKAETKALGRALAALGYGTQFCEDYDFSAQQRQPATRKRRAAPDATGAGPAERVVDAPVARRGLKVVRDRETAQATTPQVKAIYAIGRVRRGLPESGVDERCRVRFGCAPAELSKQQASEFIDLLRGEPKESAQPKAMAGPP